MYSSTAVTTDVVPGAHAFAWRSLVRPAKICGSVALIAAGAYGVFAERAYVSSSDAVVSAYVLEIRTPIDGVVSMRPLVPGTMMHEGDVVGSVQNNLAGHEHLDGLLAESSSAEAAAEALAQEQDQLRVQEARLLREADVHDRIVQQRTRQQVLAAEAEVAGLKSSSSYASQDLRRAAQLFELGVISRADLDKARMLADSATATFDSQQSSLAALRLQGEAANAGIMAEPGQNMDVTYSRQRADEIAIKLAENGPALTSLKRQADQIRRRAAEEQQRTAQRGNSELRAPAEGVLWSVQTSSGERASAGATVMSLVDCSKQFIVARIPQNRIQDVPLHETAKVRFEGEGHDHLGEVVAVSGEERNTFAGKLAATPQVKSKSAMGTMLISLGADAYRETQSGCRVGQMAKVIVPTSNVARH